MAQLLEDMSEYGVGIDPGWVSCGTAVVRRTNVPFKFEITHIRTENPSLSDALERNIFFIIDDMYEQLPVPKCGDDFVVSPSVMIERYVSYGNVRSSHTEEITMVIGALRMQIWNVDGCATIGMAKAIDWKTKLCQTLVRWTGFDNPSKTGTLDKQFSFAAARHLTTNHEKILDDHCADAVCLAAYPQVMAMAADCAANSKPVRRPSVGTKST